MTQMWTPVVGEKYRLRVRGEEEPCKGCGHIPSQEQSNPYRADLPTIHELSGTTVEVTRPVRAVLCWCGVVEQRRGYWDITFQWDGHRKAVAVPYTWLEPLGAPQRTGRVF